ncbi:MAG TPA: NTP transferase domain-containing protein [Thermoanaerobacterales bacterium]|nr:NTP transferase domain-containing protein [Thermoanaerobacterales bacterium]
MKGVIMAGGVGTRLRPLTCSVPKPMIPLMNRPIMEHILNLLKKHQINEVCATLQYLPETIKNHFQDGTDFNVNLKYYIEETPLGTAGSVKNAQEFLDETFIVISGDVLCDMDLTEAIKFHKEKKAIATLVLTREEIPLEYGVVVTSDTGEIIRFLEKPSWAEVFSDTINTGIYILEPEVLDYIKKDEMFDFSKDLFPLLLEDKQPMFGMISNCYWCDIGNPEQYIQSHKDIFDKNVKGDFWSLDKKEGIWLGKDIRIGKGSKIIPPVAIGNNCIIGDNVIIEPYSVIGDNTIINDNTSLKRSIVWKNNYIGKGVESRGCIICNKTTIKDNVSIFENAIIGDETILEPGSIIKPGIKIWPGKTIEENSTISENIIWGVKSSKYLFGERGVFGKTNVDITPETAAKDFLGS